MAEPKSCHWLCENRTFDAEERKLLHKRIRQGYNVHLCVAVIVVVVVVVVAVAVAVAGAGAGAVAVAAAAAAAAATMPTSTLYITG